MPGFLRDELAALLAERPGEDPDALVFTAPEGGPLRSCWRRRFWKPAVRKAGLPEDLRIHDLRHTAAALLIRQGAHPKAIQAHLGHSSITVTMDLYGHLFPDADGLDATFRQAASRPETASRRPGADATVEPPPDQGEGSGD
jgi:integrase